MTSVASPTPPTNVVPSQEFQNKITAGGPAGYRTNEDSTSGQGDVESDISNSGVGRSVAGASSNGEGKSGHSSSHDELADKETKAVHKLRLLMIVVLLVISAVAASLIFLFSRNSEKTEFENEFESAGSKVLRGFQDDFLRKIQAMDSLSKSITSFATNTNATWPYVTVPDTAELFQPYLDLTNAAALTILPFVPSRERSNW